jgi:tetratricopeptide (TPR) repeat protein
VELGRYAEAERAVALVPPNEADAGSWALRANMAGLRGQQESALKYWDKAVTLATRHPDLSPETVAWFHVKRGNARAMWNLPDQAEQDFTEALKIFPRDFRALESLANLSLSRQDWKSAEEWSEKLIKLAPDPDIHAMLGEAYQKTGKTQQAQAQFALADSKARLALKDAGTHSRHLVLYCADANRHLPQALRLALTDSKRRGDIYTWDTLAWALYKNRRLDEAKAASSKALALGTRDSMLWFHAGMIDAARGDRAGAKQKLTRALEINPQFHSEFPQQARATLKTL